jgi:hyperosmotically inducible protein
MYIARRPILLITALAGAMSILVSGCGNRQEDAPIAAVVPAATMTVGSEIDDTVVTTNVKAALFADPDVRAFDLKVESRKGTVQLSGFVDNQFQIDRAIATTLTVQGVDTIENGISIKQGSSTVGDAVDDGIITTRVKTALLADPNVKSLDLNVATRKGEVQLSGFVDSQSQIDEAIAVAGKVVGVTRVESELSIKR